MVGGDNVPLGRRMYVVLAMRIVSWRWVGEGLGKPIQEMDDTRREDTLMRGWGLELGWVGGCSILNKTKGRVGVIGMEEGVVPTGTFGGRSDAPATGDWNIDLTGP